MIKITKGGEPRVLVENGKDWTAILLDKMARGEVPTTTEKSRYRHPDVKSALVLETHGKCAYCESKLLHITYGDVEHISPKSHDFDSIFKWENLTLACDVCNTNKGSKFPGAVGLVDPYKHDPEDHFQFFGPYLHAKPGDVDACLTEREIDLNRSELLERRGEKIKYLRQLVEVIARSEGRLRDVLIEDLEREMMPDQEYSALAVYYLKALLRFL